MPYDARYLGVDSVRCGLGAWPERVPAELYASRYYSFMYNKPLDIFDREAEWSVLERFVSARAPGAALGLVYGRRRQGKTMLLEHLCQVSGGFYFSALEQSSAQNLAHLGRALAAFRGLGAPLSLGSWAEAVDQLLGLGKAEEPLTVVVDEVPYLLAVAPEIPSVLQAALSPVRRRSFGARLLLCGSAFSVMATLTSGAAPLRGRGSVELVVQPFDFRQAAQFWGLAPHWDLAFRHHALCGGTPAYRDYAGHEPPDPQEGLGSWVVRHLLNPASPFFREGRILVSEEPSLAGPQLYLSVLAACASGRTRTSEIAAALGRKETSLARALAVLQETRLLARVPDPLRHKRTTYEVAEPIVRFYQLVVAPNEARLGRQGAGAVWAEAARTVESKIYGPHLETLAREWASYCASEETLGGPPQVVGRTEVACREHRVHHELDIVVLSAGRVVALGEAKATKAPLSAGELSRLVHLRDLLPRASGARLMLFSSAGFSPDLVAAARRDSTVQLVDLERLYLGS